VGFTTDYIFLNGICLPNWECKEQLGGQDCAVDPFNDRNLSPISQDTTIAICFGECSEDGSCTPPAATFMATFSVDMSNETVGADGMFLTGPFVGWASDAIPMLDDDGDGIYEASTMLEADSIQYKFVNSGEYEGFDVEEECTVTTDDGQFINRLIVMEERDTIVQTYFFNSCSISSDVNELILDTELFSIRPTVSSDMVTLTWSNTEKRGISVVTTNGQVVESISSANYETEKVINVSNFAPGIYFVKMETASSFGIEKFIVR